MPTAKIDGSALLVGVDAGAAELEAGQVPEVVRRLEGPAVAGVGDPPALRRTHVAVAVERPALEHELERLDDDAVVEVPAAGDAATSISGWWAWCSVIRPSPRFSRM